jgi:hypothetical protein
MRHAFKVSSIKPYPDLDTIRETILYVLSDTRHLPDLAGVTAALERTVEEIEAVQPKAPTGDPEQLSVVGFVPRASAQSGRIAGPAPGHDTGRSDTARQSACPAAHESDLAPASRDDTAELSALQKAITDYFRLNFSRS